jgi:UDP-N-acetylmuramyl pentapeptide synthase
MQRLGIAARARSKARIVAVTGSVGKTTAKEMLRAMLSASGGTRRMLHPLRSTITGASR